MRNRSLAAVTLIAGTSLAACGTATPATPGATATATGSATSASPSATAASPTQDRTPVALTPSPGPRDYSSGSVTLPAGNKQATFALRGTIAAPPKSAGAPVAVILHMRGNPCTDDTEQLPCAAGKDARYDKGMGWLASALAARGYVAVVPDITATRDFAYEGAMVDLGWQVGQTTAERLRKDPAAFGLAADGAPGRATVVIGHSVGGDQAMWMAVRNPDDVAAAVLLEPAPARTGLFPGPDNPFAYQYGNEQTDHIPDDLPFAVVLGRCDDDAGYQGGQYTVNATVTPSRTAPAVLAVLDDADHVMLNTRAGRTTGGAWAGCPAASDASYAGTSQVTRARLATWTADFLDIALHRESANSFAARRAGLTNAAAASWPSASVVLIPGATNRATALLPLGGALGPAVDADAGAGASPSATASPTPETPAPTASPTTPGLGLAVTNPAVGAMLGTRYRTRDLVAYVCPAGGVTSQQDPAIAGCGLDTTERPGDGPALHLATLTPGNRTGTWQATLPRPQEGTVLATISAVPDEQPSKVVVTARDERGTPVGSTTLTASDLRVPAGDGDVPDRAVPVQARVAASGPVAEIDVEISGGAVFLQDVFVAR